MAGTWVSPSLEVVRGTNPYFCAFTNERYIVFVGLTVEDLLAFFRTGAEFQRDELNQLLVIRPDGSIKEQFRGDDVSIVVRDRQLPGQFCDDPSAVSYTGIGRVVGHDSDRDLLGHGADVVRIQVTATVASASDQQYHLTATAHDVLSPNSTWVNFIFLNQLVGIHLTPVGR